MFTPTDPCPCGSGAPLAECCQPILNDPRTAATAEQMMRSRYTAHVLADHDHLARTWHPKTRPDTITTDPTRWRSLRILNTVEGQPGDATGEVEFQATWFDYRLHIHHERSEFVWRANRWMYLRMIEDLSPPRWNNMKA